MRRALLLTLGLWMLGGCAISTATFDEVPDDQLEPGCEALLDQGAEPLAIGTIEGSSRYVLDTSEGRCVDEGADVVDSLRRHDHGTLVEQLARALHDQARTDPNPHPDRPKDIQRSSVSTDPNPHPDTPGPDADSAEDEETVVVIIWVVSADDDSSDDMMDSHSSRN